MTLFKYSCIECILTPIYETLLQFHFKEVNFTNFHDAVVSSL